MKRSTLFLAATLLGTACTSHSSAPGDITLFWNFQDAFRGVSGQPGDNAGCGVALVDTLDVTIDGATQTFDCAGPNSAGITLQAFAPGNYPFTIAGFRGNEQVFTGSGTARAVSNARTETDVTLQAVTPQSFDIFYNPLVSTAGTTPTQCVFDGRIVSGIIFRLEDLSGSVVATTEIVSGGTVVGHQPVRCDPASFGILTGALPLAQYRLRYLQAIDAASVSIAEACALSVSHGGFPEIVPLARPSGAPCL